MAWYEDWFESDAYELVYNERNLQEAEQLADLIERVAEPCARAEILDVGCGRGRHARVLARRGYRVTGLDLSARALEVARWRAEAEGLRVGKDVRFVQADMRLAHFQERFDGIVNLFTSFGYFADDADHANAVGAMTAALRPGGFVVQDFLNAQFVASHLVPRDERMIGDIAVVQQRSISNNRVVKDISLEKDGERHTFQESVHLLDRSDFKRYYDAAGLHLEQVFGDYEGGPHTADSPRLILLARKP
ncbi:class I SAM-dependent methyltransferase [soil metagenome]